MSSVVIDRLADRILCLREDIFVNDIKQNERFASLKDTKSFVAEQQNRSTKRMVLFHICGQRDVQRLIAV